MVGFDRFLFFRLRLVSRGGRGRQNVDVSYYCDTGHDVCHRPPPGARIVSCLPLIPQSSHAPCVFSAAEEYSSRSSPPLACPDTTASHGTDISSALLPAPPHHGVPCLLPLEKPEHGTNLQNTKRNTGPRGGFYTSDAFALLRSFVPLLSELVCPDPTSYSAIPCANQLSRAMAGEWLVCSWRWLVSLTNS